MPELPEIDAYRAALRAHVVPQRLEGLRLPSPFLLRSVEVSPREAVGRRLVDVRRLGKRVALGFEGGPWFVLHLMIAGRLRWKAPGAKLPGRAGLLALDFEGGSLLLTEQGTQRRASLHVVAEEAELRAHDPGGAEPLEADDATLRAALTREPHTIKRALCDPRLLSGVGNAWSDEVLHRARLSPFLRTREMSEEAWGALLAALRAVLGEARERAVARALEAFPDRVTAFQPEMAVHGRTGEPCPVCAAPVQRIVRGSGEYHYCAGCQTGGRILADRALSRLLKDAWPRTLDELEGRG